MLPINKSIVLYVVILLLNGCKMQKNNANVENKKLVINIRHTDSKYFGYSSSTYLLLDVLKINNFKLKKIDSVSPLVSSEMILNGAITIYESFVDFETYGCCEYKDVNKATIQYVNGDLSMKELSKYSDATKLSLDIFKNKDAIKYVFEKGTLTYEIKIWITDLEYCVCEDLYLAKDSSYLFKQKAHLKTVRSITKPDKKIKIKLKKILESIIYKTNSTNEQN